VEVADQCERLAGSVVLHLAAAPTYVPASADIMRLALASADTSSSPLDLPVLADWQKVTPTISAAPTAISHYPAAALEVKGVSEAIDACLLRLLDERMKSVLASLHCATLGPINASIARALGPTWAAWHAALSADASLLADFLPLACKCRTASALPWDGDHARIPHLATALVMMLATHHGEPLQRLWSIEGT